MRTTEEEPDKIFLETELKGRGWFHEIPSIAYIACTRTCMKCIQNFHALHTLLVLVLRNTQTVIDIVVRDEKTDTIKEL